MKLEFDEAAHAYTLDGQSVPSVTRVLAALESWESIPRDTLEAARDFGSKVHRACHLFNRGELDWSMLDESLRPYVEAWSSFLRESNATLIASETRVAHKALKYAGTFDALVDRRGHRWLIDIKSGEVMPTVGPQLAAYAQALGSPVRRYSVQLRADGTYRSKPYTSTADWSVFVSCLNLFRWREKYK